MKSWVWNILTLISSVLVSIAWLLLRVSSKLGSQKAEAWLSPRIDPTATEKTLTEIRSLGRPVVLAFASSAGEYEQILPSLEKLRSEGWSALVCFFSPSGIKFAKARKDEIPFVASPLDTLWHVNRFFEALRPQIVLVSKQELWPSFLKIASERSSLYLVDGAISESMRNKRFFTAFTNPLSLYHFFHQIFCVSHKDGEWFKELGIPPHKLQVTGDTKFDRAYQRLGKSEASRKSINEDWLACYGEEPTLVLGSAWPEDLSFVLKAAEDFPPEIRIAVVPHNPSPDMCRKLTAISNDLGFDTSLYSQRKKKRTHEKEINRKLSKQKEYTETELGRKELGRKELGPKELDDRKFPKKSISSPSTREVIVVDQLGLLFEFYDVASWAWVGGGLHHQVHNVLEPGIRGTPTAFGLKYHNSGEARDLVEEGAVLATDQPHELSAWIQRTSPKLNGRLLEAMQKKLGASERIHEWMHEFKISKMSHTYLKKLQ